MNSARWIRPLCAALSLSLVLGGCTPIESDVASPAGGGVQTISLGTTDDNEELCVLLVLDLSGSFLQRFAGDGVAYEFTKRIIDRYFRASMGTEDQLILAQISGTERSLLWKGTPLALQREFRSPEAFRDFLLASADPNGSRVYEGIRHALDYILDEPRVASGRAKVAVFVLSDMLQSPGPGGERALRDLEAALAKVGTLNGAVAIYFADQGETIPWRQRLRAAGVKNFRVESSISSQPPLPDFEE